MAGHLEHYQKAEKCLDNCGLHATYFAGKNY